MLRRHQRRLVSLPDVLPPLLSTSWEIRIPDRKIASWLRTARAPAEIFNACLCPRILSFRERWQRKVYRDIGSTALGQAKSRGGLPANINASDSHGGHLLAHTLHGTVDVLSIRQQTDPVSSMDSTGRCKARLGLSLWSWRLEFTVHNPTT